MRNARVADVGELTTRRRLAALGAVLLIAGGCQWPRDSDGTLEDVRGGVLRVGVTASPPWTTVAPGGAVAGAEARLVERLARKLDAKLEWHHGAESALMAALKDRVLDLVIGGLDAKAPWPKHASLTRPYVTTRTVVAVPAGVEEPPELAGVRVAVAAGTAEVAALRAEDAVAVQVAEVTGQEDTPVAVDDWLLGSLRLRATEHELASRDHVWAVPLGENGWQVEVERFLLDLSTGDVERLLVEAERAGAGS
jgi:polar amino acid transport system substrate-binding protein